MSHDITAAETPKMAIFRIVGAAALAMALLIGVWASMKPASAQTVCTMRAEVTDQLGSRYSKAPVAMGLTSKGAVIEVFSGSEGSIWTIVLSKPDGMSCVVATGKVWENVPFQVKVPSRGV